ncbi:MAG: insulinase family protein [Acidobacteria bacterium]|nr:insulinase family protein [Acidobacteriota bacterium]MBV9478836.1 insulinase family protein [Acidobacteriota bacterium]
MRAVRIAVLLLLAPLAAFAQDLASFEKRTTVRKLDNGLTIIITERHDAPVFSYATVVNAGSAQESVGITGLAHMFEHMAFKGSDRIGTSDWPAEEKALAKVEETYAAYDRARRQETNRDDAKVAELEKAWRDALAEADKYVVDNEFSQVVDRAGGVGVNAFTAQDITAYFFSLPSNRFELWAFLESERLRHPVFRQFYKERDVVTEERRMRVESDPFGRLEEEFVSAAFVAHPYGLSSGVGWPSDLASFSATDAAAFFKKYYVPSNIVIALVGDVKASDAMPVLEKYFGRLPKAPAPEPLRTVEPPQRAERTVVLRESSQPIYMEGYHRPASTDPNNATYDVISMLLSSGRTSRLYRSLVRDKKIAANAGGGSGYPGEKYPNLFVVQAVPTPGHTPDEDATAIHAELERLKTEDVPADELQSVKTRVKAGLIRELDSNSGLALELASYQTLYGDWRELFREVDRIDKVTAADVKRVATETFVPLNRTVGKLESTRGGAK